uniref:Cation efflux protein cytoplasmic domain-containing protein n=1 Tax=Araucaria cunninghamii TaxID=56994 RepID=A0A0D6R0K2_ARACU
MASIHSEPRSKQGQEITPEVLPLTRPNKDSMNCGRGCGFSDLGSRAEDVKIRTASIRKLWMAVLLCLVFMSVEVVGGIKANSLAILTDAAHLLTDVAGFAISLFSIWASGWEATPRQTYGFFRLEILGALLSIQLIWLLTGILVYEAIERMLHSTSSVNGRLMFIIATFGLVVNIVMIFLLGHGHAHGHDHSKGHWHDHGHEHVHKGKHIHKHDHGHADEHGHSHDVGHAHEHGPEDKTDLTKPLLSDVERGEHSGHEHLVHSTETVKSLGHGVKNAHSEGNMVKVDHDVSTRMQKDVESKGNINVQGAYLHVLGDLIQSIGVMIGGAVIWIKPEWKIIDLICTLFFSLLVLGTTIKMIRSVIDVLMESTPREIDATRLEAGLCSIPGVLTVHELHIWAITVGKTLLACHVRIQSDADADAVLQRVIDYIEREYKITHTTVQIEREA